MSGHSKWATIKRKKGAIDAARGKIFTKLGREITTAVRLGGGDPSGNPRLRSAIIAAKAERMPNDNIQRAIKKGTGDTDGAAVEELSYEGYGPGGVAFVVDTQTENKNRTGSEVRAAFTKNGGNLGATGSVGWMFHKRGQFVFDANRYTEDELTEAALDAGADDVKADSDTITITCDVKEFAHVMTALEKRSLEFNTAELTMIPENLVKVSGEAAETCLRMVERLEELDDVQKVYVNFDIDDSELERIAALS
ncbi:MAG: YebC/PmpR family DNA-binding transcriptional regulator [Clostridia bacterium]|nr:YebC/PmpR family DNA-binding transcriptional regulator [Deltaproteobacteria bacterium]